MRFPAVEQQADLVAVECGAVCEHRCQQGGVFELGVIHSGTGVVHGAAGIYRQKQHLLALFVEGSHIGCPGAGRYFPVDEARLVSGDIFAEVIKIQPLTTKAGAVLSGKGGRGELACHQLDASHALHDFLRLIHDSRWDGCLLYGTGTLERMLSMTLSLVLLAASAS